MSRYEWTSADVGPIRVADRMDLYLSTVVYSSGNVRVRAWIRDVYSHAKTGRAKGIPSSVINPQSWWRRPRFNHHQLCDFRDRRRVVGDGSVCRCSADHDHEPQEVDHVEA